MDLLDLLMRVEAKCLGKEFAYRIANDQKGGDRLFLQVMYSAPCTKGGEVDLWKGRKWYLSEHMTDDEIIKTAYAAFEAAVKHEIMEGFKVDGKILFNPHVNFEELLKISDREIKRE